jgi:hypothetical protein
MIVNKSSSAPGSRSIFVNLTVVAVFTALMVGFIMYFYENEPDVKRVALATLADQFSSSATNAHWQWQAEGRPELILLVHYNIKGQETDRRPISMSKQGWPLMEQTSEGCGKLWEMVLNMPLSISGFRVYPEYYDGMQLSGKEEDAKCRFRLSTGPYFEYMVYSGQVNKTNI